MKRVIKISKSFKEAEEWDIEQAMSMTPEERLDIVQYLRERYYKMRNEDRKGLQRVYKIIKRKKG